MAFPLIPVLIAGLTLAACASAMTTPKVKRPLTSLAGSEWSPHGMQGQFVQFRSGGELSGSGGCNNFFGTYTVDGETLTIGPLASTKKMCASGMMEEQAFLSALQKARRIETTHLTLAMYDETGRLLLDLQRRDWD